MGRGALSRGEWYAGVQGSVFPPNLHLCATRYGRATLGAHASHPIGDSIDVGTSSRDHATPWWRLRRGVPPPFPTKHDQKPLLEKECAEVRRTESWRGRERKREVENGRRRNRRMCVYRRRFSVTAHHHPRPHQAISLPRAENHCTRERAGSPDVDARCASVYGYDFARARRQCMRVGCVWWCRRTTGCVGTSEGCWW